MLKITTLTKNREKGSWRSNTDTIHEEYNITESDKTGSKETTKKKIRKKIETTFKTKLIKSGENKSKVKFFLENRGEWTIGKRATYLNKLNRMEASIIFKARTRMLDIKNNYKNKYRDKTCRLCNQQEEDQIHVLSECTGLNTKGLQPVPTSSIFSDNIETLKAAAKNIQLILQAINPPTT